MTVISELPRIERWLYSVLSGDGTIASIVGTRIYAGVIPKTVSLVGQAAIVFLPLSAGEDTRGTGTTRIWTRPLYLVKAVIAAGSLASLQTLVDRIDTVLHGQQGATSGVTINSCVRERAFRMTTVEDPANTVYQHLGGEYRFAASALVNP